MSLAQSSIGPLFVTVFGLKSVELPRDSRTLLCLHGVGAHGLRFVGLADQLPEATIVAPDLRGHGRSPKHGPWTVEQHIRDVLPLMRKLGPRVIVVGHSYGGLIAWELARAAHDQLAGLVLVDPAIAMDHRDVEQFKAEAQDPPRWRNSTLAMKGLMTGRQPAAQWSVALDVAVGLELDGSGALRPRAAPEAVVAAWDAIKAPPQPTSWRGPTLLLEAGQENGRYVSPWLVKAMDGQLGDRLQHVVLDSPHTITGDHPDLLAEQVREFMERLQPR